jgi:DNA polymerase-3 subunit beta
MKKATIAKVIKAVINKNTVLPILEDVYLTGDEIQVTDLETHVVIPYRTGIETCLPSSIFLDALDEKFMKEPKFSFEKTLVPVLDDKGNPKFSNGKPVVKQGHGGVLITDGKRKIKSAWDDPMNFVKLPFDDKSDYMQIGHLSVQATVHISTALKFVSNDDLRPSMTGIYFDKNIVATDAHRLFRIPMKDFGGEELMEHFILPAKTAKILLIMDCAWDVFYSGHNVCFINAEGVMVFSRIIDAMYPQYNVVIPNQKDAAPITMTVNPTALRRELKNAVKYSNRSTNQVTFSLNGDIGISSQDVDFSFEYGYKFEKDEATYTSTPKGDDHFNIAFNGKFLDQVVAELGDQPITMKFWTPRKCTIVNEYFLLMPLMLNE